MYDAMQTFRPGPRSLALLLLLACAGAPVMAGNGPVIDYQTAMDTHFDDNGTVRFGDYTVVFAPEGAINGGVAVMNKAGQPVGKFSFFADYQSQEGVYARVRTKGGPPELKLTEPGPYVIAWIIDGEVVTAMPIILEQTSTGDDPFNPVSKFRFDGVWRKLAYITTREQSDGDVPEFHFWMGGRDLKDGESKDRLDIQLLREGTLVAHGKEAHGYVSTGHFQRQNALLYHPHEKKDAVRAPIFASSDFSDGSYELKVIRRSDRQLLRGYDFEVENGRPKAHARSALDVSPGHQYLAPRLHAYGQFYLRMSEAVWIEDRDI